MRHNQAECIFGVHFHVNELLHIETQNIVIIASLIPIHEHGLTTRSVREVLNHSWLRNVEEVTCGLDGISDVVLR